MIAGAKKFKKYGKPRPGHVFVFEGGGWKKISLNGKYRFHNNVSIESLPIQFIKNFQHSMTNVKKRKKTDGYVCFLTAMMDLPSHFVPGMAQEICCVPSCCNQMGHM